MPEGIDDILVEISQMAGMSAPGASLEKSILDHQKPDPEFKAEDETVDVQEESEVIDDSQEEAEKQEEVAPEPEAKKSVDNVVQLSKEAKQEEEVDDSSPVEVPEPLVALLEKYARGMIEGRQAPVEQEPEEQPVQSKQVEQPKQAQPAYHVPSFIDEQVVEEIGENPLKMNEVLQNVYRKAVQDALMLSFQRNREEIQNVVRMERTVENFFNKNPDLLPVRNLVSVVFVDLKKDNPGLSDDKILEMTAKQARKEIRKIMSFSGKKDQTANKPAPAFASPTPARPTPKPAKKDKMSVLEEIEMMRKLGG